MSYTRKSTKQTFDEGSMNLHDYPLHDLGDAFFAMTTIEEADNYFFKGLHRHDFYELLWFTDVAPGEVHCIDFRDFDIARNQVCLLLPGQVHSMEQHSKRGFLMAMSSAFFERLIGNEMLRFLGYASNFSLVIPDEWEQVLHTIVMLVKQEYEGEARPAILESYLRSWFLHCIELQKASGTGHSDPRLQMLSEVIEVHFRKERHAEFYARKLSISAKRLNELTRESFGKTISQMINDRLILEAKREIGYINKPIKEISYELGFSEPSYFTRFFGKQTGFAPQDFRKQIVSANQPGTP